MVGDANQPLHNPPPDGCRTDEGVRRASGGPSAEESDEMQIASPNVMTTRGSGT